MKLTTAVAIVMLAITPAFAQSPAPLASPAASPLAQRRALPGRRGMLSGNQNPSATPTAVLHQRIGEMQATLDSMHALIKQMRAKAAKSGTKDPLVKANLDLWNLMVGHLDKQLEELKLAAAAREDLEARRASLYKQADEKAEAEARAARAAMAAKFAGDAATAVSAGQGAVQTPAGQTAPAPAPAAQTPSAAAAPQSPATSTPSPN